MVLHTTLELLYIVESIEQKIRQRESSRWNAVMINNRARIALLREELSIQIARLNNSMKQRMLTSRKNEKCTQRFVRQNKPSVGYGRCSSPNRRPVFWIQLVIGSGPFLTNELSKRYKVSVHFNENKKYFKIFTIDVRRSSFLPSQMPCCRLPKSLFNANNSKRTRSTVRYFSPAAMTKLRIRQDEELVFERCNVTRNK